MRLVGRGQTQLRRQLANLGFGQTDFLERRAHLKLQRGPRTRSKIAEVARVFAVGNHGEAIPSGNRRQLLEQLVFAEVTTIVRIGQVVGIFKFLGTDDADGDLKLVRNLQRLSQFAPRQAR